MVTGNRLADADNRRQRQPRLAARHRGVHLSRMAEEEGAASTTDAGASEDPAAAPETAMSEEAPESGAERPGSAAPPSPPAQPGTELAFGEEPSEMGVEVAEPPKAPEPPKEFEEDAPEDKRKRVKEPPTCLPTDTTLNVLPSVHGNVLMALTDGGMQYLLAGARANVGIKSGRYMFEVKIVEILNPAEPPGQRGRTPLPRQLLRIGFSSAGSSLFLTSTDESVCFDSEGCFVHGKSSTHVSRRFACDQVICVVLNVDADSKNADTVSLFVDGVRASQPQPLPENLKGKPLFPAVNFRNLTVNIPAMGTAIEQLNFEPM